MALLKRLKSPYELPSHLLLEDTGKSHCAHYRLAKPAFSFFSPPPSLPNPPKPKSLYWRQPNLFHSARPPRQVLILLCQQSPPAPYPLPSPQPFAPTPQLLERTLPQQEASTLPSLPPQDPIPPAPSPQTPLPAPKAFPCFSPPPNQRFSFCLAVPEPPYKCSPRSNRSILIK